MKKGTKQFLILLVAFILIIIACNNMTYENIKAKNEEAKKEINIINGAEETPAVTVLNDKETESNETISQRNAVKQAKSYIETMPFSKKELINQLIFNKYSKEDAKYAVNKLEIDYKIQAVRQAKSYLETMAFSKEELLHQLKFNGYTDEQAEYAVNEVYK